MKRQVLSLLIIFLFSGCETNQYVNQSGVEVNFYLIKNFSRVGTTAKIIESSVTLSDSIIIHYDEILSYNRRSHTFTVTKPCADRLTDFENNHIHGTPFAVAVDHEIIYTGYFWCGFSSSMVDWITIDPLNYSGKNLLPVSLGYPGIVQGDFIPDNRNDYRILNVLFKDGKLR